MLLSQVCVCVCSYRVFHPAPFAHPAPWRRVYFYFPTFSKRFLFFFFWKNTLKTNKSRPVTSPRSVSNPTIVFFSFSTSETKHFEPPLCVTEASAVQQLRNFSRKLWPLSLLTSYPRRAPGSRPIVELHWGACSDFSCLGAGPPF